MKSKDLYLQTLPATVTDFHLPVLCHKIPVITLGGGGGGLLPLASNVKCFEKLATVTPHAGVL